MSRTKNLIRTMYSNIMLQLVTVICGLILPPLMIKEYGSEVNGLISTIKQLLTYFSIVSLGLGAASSVALYRPLHEKKYDQISGILSATRLFFNKTGCLFSILVAISAFLLPIFSDLDELSFFNISFLILICGIGSISEYIIISKYKVLLTADQKLYVLAKIQAQGVVINTFFSVLLIELHASIIIVQIVATISYLLRLMLTIKYVKEEYKEVNFYAVPNFDAIDNRWDAFSYQISDMIITYTPILLIALLCGYEQASIYSIYNMIFMSVAMLVGIFSSGFSASFGNLIISKNIQILNKSFKEYEFIYTIIVFTAYSSALILILPFINIYIRNSDGVNYIIEHLAILFTFSGLFKLIRIPSVILVEASGHFKQNKKGNILEASFNIIISLFLVFKLGISGILIGSCITALVRSLVYIYYASINILNVGYKKRYFITAINTFVMWLIFILWKNQITFSTSYFNWTYDAILVGICNLTIFIVINIIISPGSFYGIVKKIRLHLSL